MTSAAEYCEVIGCNGSAEWVRIEDFNACHEEYLCSRCWAELYAREPQQAVHYTCCNENLDLPMA